MSVRRGWVIGAVLSALLLVTGCGRDTENGPARQRQYAAADLVLRVENVDGFVPAMTRATNMPLVSVYGDGRVITVGATPAIYPGPALPSVQVQHISLADVSRLADLAIMAGVGDGQDLGQPPVADAPSTRFTVLPDQPSTGTGDAPKPKVTTVNALTIPLGDHDGLTDGQRSGRRNLMTLYDQLINLSSTLGAAALDQPQAYLPVSIAAISMPWQDPGTAGVPAPPEQAWPGPELPGPSMRQGLAGCVTTAGAATTAVLAAAAKANVVTPWVSGGQRWLVGLRPLLPDETSCANLGR